MLQNVKFLEMSQKNSYNCGLHDMLHDTSRSAINMNENNNVKKQFLFAITPGRGPFILKLLVRKTKFQNCCKIGNIFKTAFLYISEHFLGMSRLLETLV